MSRIYDALKKLEAERRGAGGETNGTNGHQANGHTNGHGNGNGNGHHRNGRRRVWEWIFKGQQARTNGAPVVNFQLGPEVEEAYQQLGTNLLVGPSADVGREPKLLGVVASRHGEGATTTASVFASILVRRRGGRVVVVEANLRSPGFETVFGIKRNGGFAELVLGQQSLAQVAQPTQIPNLYAVGCGSAEIAPSTLFESPGVSAALDQLREQFDFVIFDLPPVNVYGDTSILGPRLDAAVLVIEADRTRISDVERARRNLERVGVRFVGSVLNRRRNYIPAFLEEML